MLDTSYRTAYNEDHEAFRDTVRKVFAEHMTPFLDQHEEEGIVPRSAWKALGEAGMLCPTVKEENGGLGLDFGFNCVLCEELSYLGSSAGFTLQNDITANYIERLGTEEQRQKYLPGMVSGDIISAIAMTEPGAGSDLQGIRTTAIKDGNHLVVNGSKTYITNGQNADVIIVVAKTDPAQGAKGTSLVLVDADAEGFERGRNLDKIGQHSADTSELFFNDVRVPMTNILGGEGRGFIHLMEELPQERLGIAVGGQAAAQRAFDEAVKFTKDRKAFGKTVFEFQNTKFVLADLKAKLQVGWAHLDWAIKKHLAGELTTDEASAAKLWHTDLQWEACDVALQLHGGAGYMNEYAIARLWRDARVTRIFGGTNEIMKEVISRSI
ncbi:acyl-CoA dehydrogenase family protein [Qipengyuania flava]|uniref:Acyl-CoA dehydrogenase n=1 Tax=Qipengyuania flava TaxID=192812 RepID=A0A3T1CKW0_9SPHN|nr:acyl-CoA dehydrogenase family protein [Qipengyuania flava]MEC7740991.1 acyl-CoA dehydrogenase family protein [Pseudomonadota bacterium]NIJ63003.1 alkylation response protein AidB-like acyl-CoA dehydrogenase [Qipengyuania flava]QFI64351.1 acyl-CoA dehydrogenase [Qipengyuania flava]BBI21629.1 acyl-CoA dehydrogenase [Qipengyuania flava]